MKIIKTIIPLILLFVSSFAFGQNVYIPDPDFKAALLAANVTFGVPQGTNYNNYDYYINSFSVDSNNDGEISETEAFNVKGISIWGGYSIQSFLGLEAFTNLKYLKINDSSIPYSELGQLNQLKALNINGTNNFSASSLGANTNLEYLELEQLSIPANTDFGLISGLKELEFSNNVSHVSNSLDLSTCTSLEIINMSSFQSLVSININNLLNLLWLDVRSTNLTTIDVSTNVNLSRFLINSTTGLTSLDISNNLNLRILSVYNSQLTSIDLSNNIALERLYLNDNPLTELDLSNNLALEYIYCNNSLLSSLDVSHIPTIWRLHYNDNPNLTYVNQKSDRYITPNNNNSFNATNCPNLQFVCEDEGDVSVMSTYFANQGMTVNVNSYCSFVPGGDYNIITGNITFDFDNNGCDANDLVFPFNKININDGIETGATFTTNSGEYNFFTQDGTFTITPDLENLTFFDVTPLDATINFPDTNNNIAIQDFCITANGVHNDVEIVMGPTIPARPGFDAEYLITYKNKGNQTLSGDFSFNYDDAVLDFLTATEVPITQTSGQLTWDYTNLLPFESRSVYVTLNVNSPQETPAVNIGDVLDFTVVINPIAGDELPDDNTFNYNQTVVGAYDPNDITCLEGDILEPTEIGEYLHYIINFENTGNFPAQNIVVATEIDPTMFDVSTLRVLSSSHDAYVKQTGDLVEIVFESIYLSSGGHGNILLKVQSQDILVEDDTVTKSANIFFDYNFPIQTNDANTTYQQLLSTTTYGIDQNVTIYPNPVKNWVTISSKENIKSVSVFDVQGRVLQTQITNNREVKIDLSSRSDGIYFVKIQTEKGIKVEKIIKQ